MDVEHPPHCRIRVVLVWCELVTHVGDDVYHTLVAEGHQGCVVLNEYFLGFVVLGRSGVVS